MCYHTRMSHYDLPHRHGQDVQRVLAKMPEPERFEVVADLIALAGDPTRLRILWVLCHCTECVTNIGAVVGMSVAAVSHHLQILRRGGVIVREVRGRETYYSLAETHEAQLLHRTIDALFALPHLFESLPCPINEA